MRARMALSYAKIPVEIREISLKHKPAHLLQVSPKATVPVLVMQDGKVIDQSFDIMQWALQFSDTDGWLNVDMEKAIQLIRNNDSTFKQSLDRYKYANRYPEHTETYYRSQGEVFLLQLEHLLNQNKYLLANTPSLADIAIFPFIRQFAAVDKNWFDASVYSKLKAWLENLVESDIFTRVMVKYPLYEEIT